MAKFKPKNAPKRNPFLVLLLIALIGAAMMLLSGPEMRVLPKKPEAISITKLSEKYKEGELVKITVTDNAIEATAKDDTVFKAVKEPRATMVDLGFTDELNQTDIEIIDTSGSKFWMNLLVGAIPLVLLIGFLVFISRKKTRASHCPNFFSRQAPFKSCHRT